MTDPTSPTGDQLDKEVAELRRFLRVDLLPAVLANDNVSPAQVMELWREAATKAGLIPDQGVAASRLPTSEDIRRWNTEIKTFFDELKREFPDTYRDPAFRAAAQARVPDLVKRLLKPTL